MFKCSNPNCKLEFKALSQGIQYCPKCDFAAIEIKEEKEEKKKKK